METELEITNFKSIKFLQQPCSRVNIFLGEPNTGKSNILEAVGLFSYSQFYQNTGLDQFVRYSRTADLFYDQYTSEPLSVKLGQLSVTIKFREGKFEGIAKIASDHIVNFNGNFNRLQVVSQGPAFGKPPLVKFYKFEPQDTFPRPESEYLLPPDGKNLISLLLTNRELKNYVSSFFPKYGMKLYIKPHEDTIEIVKQSEDVLIAYPYSLISDTLQRIIFHLSAVISNEDSILIFQEPESHTFPYFTKHLAEMISIDKNNNQYFIATHNPYFLEPIIEKTPKTDLSVFITYFEDHQTKVKLLNSEEIEEIMSTDVFSNFDKYILKS